jgi:hypothetical protein
VMTHNHTTFRQTADLWRKNAHSNQG